MGVVYKDFIKQNKMPKEATKIGVYDGDSKVIDFPIPTTNKINSAILGEKLYSFGAIADIHLQYDTAQADFQKALTYLNENESVAFTCIAGDLTSNGSAEQLKQYKNYIETYSPNTPVYAVTGNHEGYNSNIADIIEEYTGHPLYYSFDHGNDVFIMVGVKSSSGGSLFTVEELQWLYETLEENRNKRCFVFQHVRPQDGCGNAFGIYNYDIWGGTEQTVFESLMSHYHNVILFHGHSHLKYYLQYGSEIANYDNIFSCHSVHISSLAVPRDGDVTGANSRQEIYADSEGYVVDVYENHIVLRGRDFVLDKFIPIAIYQLDTTLQTIEEKTYIDSTGTIDTNVDIIPPQEIPCTSITLSEDELTFTDFNTQTLIATIEPLNTTESIMWQSSDTNVATVIEGVVEPISKGNCTITAVCGEYSAICEVKVEVDWDSLTLPFAKWNINPNDLVSFTLEQSGFSATYESNVVVGGYISQTFNVEANRKIAIECDITSSTGVIKSVGFNIGTSDTSANTYAKYVNDYAEFTPTTNEVYIQFKVSNSGYNGGYPVTVNVSNFKVYYVD